MLSEKAVQQKGILFIAKMFGSEYVKEHLFSACSSVCYDYIGDESNYFVGFDGDEKNNKWTVYASVGVNKRTGDVRFFDFKLPNGRRMKKPVHPVLSA